MALQSFRFPVASLPSTSRTSTACSFLPCAKYICREVVGDYCKHARQLALRLLEAISESLGLEKDYMEKALAKQAQHMAINYYPPCPQPELTYGLPSHKDPNAITLLLQDGVSGLQVFRNGKWVAVDPIPNALVINIGDQIQVNHSTRKRRKCYTHMFFLIPIISFFPSFKTGAQQ